MRVKFPLILNILVCGNYNFNNNNSCGVTDALKLSKLKKHGQKQQQQQQQQQKLELESWYFPKPCFYGRNDLTNNQKRSLRNRLRNCNHRLLIPDSIVEFFLNDDSINSLLTGIKSLSCGCFYGLSFGFFLFILFGSCFSCCWSPSFGCWCCCNFRNSKGKSKDTCCSSGSNHRHHHHEGDRQRRKMIIKRWATFFILIKHNAEQDRLAREQVNGDGFWRKLYTRIRRKNSTEHVRERMKEQAILDVDYERLPSKVRKLNVKF